MAIKVANNQSLTAITSIPASITGGAMTLLETQTASSSDTLDFTSDIDSTYDEYVFKFYDLNPGTDASYFTFQGETGTNTDYNETMTTTFFSSWHPEDDSGTNLGYGTGDDQAQGTAFQRITGLVGSGADESGAGVLHIFDPSNTTFVKHFIARMQYMDRNNASTEIYSAGYFNVTTALTRFQFKFHQGNFDGVIKLYGIS